MAVHDPDSLAAPEPAAGTDAGHSSGLASELGENEDRLLALLERWQELYLRQEDATPEALGVEDPALRDALRQRIDEQKRLYEFLKLPLVSTEEATADLGDVSTQSGVPTPDTGGPVEPARRIGRYLVVAALGAGGQAQVFRVVHPELGQELVLKLARRSLAADPAGRERLLREGRLLAACEQPNLVRVVDLDFHDGRPFLVMEHVHGLNLEQYRDQRRPGLRQAAAIVAELARAVEYIHARGILHLDIKPKNVLIDAAGRPKLIDFGLARLRHAWSEDAAGPTGGTTSYMSPEQARGEEDRIGPWTDVFGLGGVLYYLLTGRPVYQSTSGLAALRQASQGEQVSPREANPRIPRRLERLCLKALAPDPEHRYRTAGDLERALRRFLWTPAAAAIGLVVLVILSVAILATRPRSLPSETPTKARPGDAENGSDLQGAALPRIIAFDVYHFRRGSRLQSLGTIGKSSDETRCGDMVRVKVRFDTPVYYYLVALNPDGKVEPCPPEKATTWPSSGEEVDFPGGAEQYFGLGTEPGLQAFVVLASRKPLPPYTRWPARDDWPWTHASPDGVWRFDGRWIQLVSSKARGTVTTISDSPRPFRDVCEYLQNLPGIEVSQAISFPVKPKD
jgi:serine/threonine protein kinase